MSAVPALFGRGRRALLLGLLANGLAQAASAVAGSLLVKFALDRLLEDRAHFASEVAWPIGMALFGVACGAAWLRVNERGIAERLGQHYAMQVRLALYDHLTGMPARSLQERSRGALVLRFVGDLNALRQWVSLGIGRLMVTALVAIGVLTTLALLNWKLALVVSAILGVGTIALLPIGEQLRQRSRASRRRLGRLAANISERINALAVVQACGQTQRERRRFARLSEKLRDSMLVKARSAGWLRAVTEFTAATAHGAALMVGALQVAAGEATVGSVVAAMMVVAVLLPQLRDLGRVQQYWHGAIVSLKKIEEFMLRPAPLREERADAPKLAPKGGRLELRGVTVTGVLNAIDAVAEAGSTVAIIGTNGAGKSTLLAVAARLFDVDAGEVLLDGQRLQDCQLDSVRRAVGMVSPDLPLLRGSVERNLRYRLPRATEGEQARVRALCGIEEMLDALPQGAATRIAEGGLGLSSGQRQRVALARALLGAPVLLLLDEADANLDAQAGHVIDRVLAQHHGTALIITHRRERVLQADQVWYMEHGRIVEAGTPADLMNGDTRTARLFSALRIAAA